MLVVVIMASSDEKKTQPRFVVSRVSRFTISPRCGRSLAITALLSGRHRSFSLRSPRQICLYRSKTGEIAKGRRSIFGLTATNIVTKLAAHNAAAPHLKLTATVQLFSQLPATTLHTRFGA